jgi:hypothetical protein
LAGDDELQAAGADFVRNIDQVRGCALLLVLRSPFAREAAAAAA